MDENQGGKREELRKKEGTISGRLMQSLMVFGNTYQVTPNLCPSTSSLEIRVLG